MMSVSSLDGLSVASVHSVMHNGIARGFIDNAAPRFSDCFVLVRDGSCVYRFSTGETFTAKKDDLFYLPRGSVYTMDVADRYDVLYVNFFFDAAYELSPFCLGTKKRSAVRLLFERLYAVNLAKTRAYKTERLGVMYELLAEILRLDDDATATYAHRGFMERIYAYIGERISDASFSVDDIARHFGIGNEYLRKLFRASNGVPPVRYITLLRMEKAAALLKEYPTLTVNDVAEKCGYDDACYFSRVFRKTFGVPPSDMKSASR